MNAIAAFALLTAVLSFGEAWGDVPTAQGDAKSSPIGLLNRTPKGKLHNPSLKRCSDFVHRKPYDLLMSQAAAKFNLRDVMEFWDLWRTERRARAGLQNRRSASQKSPDQHWETTFRLFDLLLRKRHLKVRRPSINRRLQ